MTKTSCNRQFFSWLGWILAKTIRQTFMWSSSLSQSFTPLNDSQGMSCVSFKDFKTSAHDMSLALLCLKSCVDCSWWCYRSSIQSSVSFFSFFGNENSFLNNKKNSHNILNNEFPITRTSINDKDTNEDKIMTIGNDADTSQHRALGLARLGLFIDEENRLRVLDADARQDTQRLIQECNAFIESE